LREKEHLMKRSLLIIGIVLLCVSATLYAEESVLINFNDLTADYPADNPAENTATMIDFSSVAGTQFTEEEKEAMKTSLAMSNWRVQLASSSQTVENERRSMTKTAPVGENSRWFPNENVMGVRVHFPEQAYNSWAMVKPPFEIPAFADVTELQDGDLIVPQDQQGRGSKFVNYGVVKNIGVIRSITVSVHGLNFPHGLGLILENENGEERQIFIGYLDFNGWKELTWQNPNYVTDVRNRELRRYPLYPKAAPYLKLKGIIFYRDASMSGGNFISYIHDIKLTYDKAVLELERGINDEQVWGILQEREERRKQIEMRRLGELQILEMLEERKMHETGATEGQNGGNQGDQGGED